MSRSQRERVTKTFSQFNTPCGMCGLRWNDCKCPQTNRTESVESLFFNPNLPPDAERPHLCLFAYHHFHRWTSSAEEHEYSVACLPIFEGWYSAFLKITNPVPIHVSFLDEPTLSIAICYGDSSTLQGVLSRDGHIWLYIIANQPPAGTDFDFDRRMLRAHIRISQTLTLDEIQHSTRGVVRGYGSSLPNNGRKISHVVEDKRENCVVSLIKTNINDSETRLSISTDRIKKFSPHIFEEAKWRTRRRFTKEQGAVVREYLLAFFKEAARADDDARYVLSREWLHRPYNFQLQLSKLGAALQRLASTEVQMSKDSDHDDGKEEENSLSTRKRPFHRTDDIERRSKQRETGDLQS